MRPMTIVTTTEKKIVTIVTKKKFLVIRPDPRCNNFEKKISGLLPRKK